MSRHLSIPWVVAVLALNLLSPCAAPAQSFPSKPVRIIVPSGAGGNNDVTTRGLAQWLGDSMAQAFVVENRGGAEGIIGTEACAKSAPDGYTLCSTAVNVFTFTPVLRLKLPYDTVRDFVPIAHQGYLDAVIVVHPSLPANSIADLINLAKAKPDSITWATFGPNTSSFYYMEWLRRTRGAPFLHVPYKTSAQSHTANIAGEVQVNLYGAGLAAAPIKAGKLRALAITGDKRSALLPEGPSFKEAGIDLPIRTWYGLFAPAATPREIVQRLNTEAVRAMAQPIFIDKFMTAVGISPPGPMTPEDFAAFLKRDREAFAELAKTIGLKPE